MKKYVQINTPASSEQTKSSITATGSVARKMMYFIAGRTARRTRRGKYPPSRIRCLRECPLQEPPCNASRANEHDKPQDYVECHSLPPLFICESNCHPDCHAPYAIAILGM